MEGKTSAKAELRAKIRSRLRELPLPERASQSKQIRELLRFPTGSKVALFAGRKTEVQLLELLHSDQSIEYFLPRVLNDSHMEFLPLDRDRPLQKSALGIMEPLTGIPAEVLNYIVCPGLAFSPQGERLGQGGGFYDRALAKYPSAQLIGVCFQCQLLDQIPTEVHDLKMDRVITPLREL